jgi:hypothetical protein
VAKLFSHSKKCGSAFPPSGVKACVQDLKHTHNPGKN